MAKTDALTPGCKDRNPPLSHPWERGKRPLFGRWGEGSCRRLKSASDFTKTRLSGFEPVRRRIHSTQVMQKDWQCLVGASSDERNLPALPVLCDSSPRLPPIVEH